MASTLCKDSPVSKAEQLRRKYRTGSSITIDRVVDGRGDLIRLRLQLFGPVARIPSLKQSKLPGFNFMANDVRQRLRVMDELYQDALDSAQPSFGDKPIAVILICGRRPQSFDKDNCVNTIQDWFEPSSKSVGKTNKKPRGWGIGVVQNDKQITCLPFYDWQLGLTQQHTTIVAVPWTHAENSIIGLATGTFGL